MGQILRRSAVNQIGDEDISSAMIAEGSIVNADISATAAIAKTKLASLDVVDADVNAAAAIADTKLAQIATASKVSGAALTLLGSIPAGAGLIPNANIANLPALGTNPSPARQTAIVNAEVDAAAAIAYSKLNLAGGIVNADVNAAAAIADTKLAQIATASKVSGAALTALASIPAGAGVIPAANLPAALTFRCGQTTRANAAGTGVQNIAHGLGATPKMVRITAFWGSSNNTGQYCISFGVAYDAANEFTTIFAFNQGTGAHLIDQDGAKVLSLRIVDGTGQGAATITALDATNIELTWSTAVGATHTCFITWEALT